MCLLGETPQHIARGKFEDSEFPSELKTGVPASLLERRPDIRSAENALASAYYGVNVAKAALLPSISLSGQAGWTNNLSGSIMNPTGLVLGVAASLFQPVFHGGALRGQLRISKSQMEQARLSLVQTILNAGAEVNTALSLYQKAIVKEQWRNRQIESLSSASRTPRCLCATPQPPIWKCSQHNSLFLEQKQDGQQTGWKRPQQSLTSTVPSAEEAA